MFFTSPFQPKAAISNPKIVLSEVDSFVSTVNYSNVKKIV